MTSADLFAIGSSGLRGYRAQMGAISENIANSGTPGFGRRTVRLTESPSSGAVQPLYKGMVNFGGSDIDGVYRASDPYLDATARMTGAALASADARVQWFGQIETALGDDNMGVGNTIANFYGSITKLAASPADSSLRNDMLYSLEQVASAFRNTSTALGNVQTSIAESGRTNISGINDALDRLTRINEELLASQQGTSNRAQLLDERDAELTAISSRLNVTISFGQNETAQVSYGSTLLTTPKTPQHFSLSVNSDQTLALSVAGSAAAAPAGGALGGLFQSASAATSRMATLNGLATSFVSDVNAWHAAGLTDAGVAGAALLSGTSAANVTLLVTDTTKIAAKSTNGTINGNLIAATSARANSSVESGWTALVSANATQLATVNSEQASASARDVNARSAREDASGVDLDTEAADLVRVQQSYQACARVIQAAKETVDAIFKIV